MSEPILYFRPIELKVGRHYEGAEWGRLVAPTRGLVGKDAGAPASQIRAATEHQPARGAARGTSSFTNQPTPVPAQLQRRGGDNTGSEAGPELPTAPTPSANDRGCSLESGTLPSHYRQPQQNDRAPAPSLPSSEPQTSSRESATDTKPTSPIPAISGLISRTKVAEAQKYRDLKRLSLEARTAEPGKARADINRSIRQIRDKQYTPGALTKSYVDIDGNPIGIVQVSNSEQVPSGCIPIAPTRTVSSIGFDFVERREQLLSRRDTRRDIINEMKLALRFTAIISEEGYDVLERLAKQIIKSSPHRFGVQFERGWPSRVPKQEIKRILRAPRTFDTEIDHIPIHISTNGKVELYSVIPPTRLVTAHDLHFPVSKNRHAIFTKFSPPPKKWVLRTSNEFNQAVAAGFQNLAHVLGRIFD